MYMTALVCLYCASKLLTTEDRAYCQNCITDWPIIDGVPVVVDSLTTYIRTTAARSETAKSKTFGPLLRSLERPDFLNKLTETSQLDLLIECANAHRANFEFFDHLLDPLSVITSKGEVFDENDLSPHLGGYGPVAAVEYLLQDWRNDTNDGLELANLHLPAERCERAVVLGSGAGRALAVLAERVDEVIGVDLSYLLAQSSNLLCQGQFISIHEIRLNHVRKISDRITVHRLGDGVVHKNVSIVVGDAIRTPLSSGCADWVVASFLFDLLADGRLLIQEIRRLLRPGGFAVLMTVFGYDQDNLWSYYTPEQILRIFEEFGFRIITTSWHVHSYLNSPKSTLARHSEMLRIFARVL